LRRVREAIVAVEKPQGLDISLCARAWVRMCGLVRGRVHVDARVEPYLSSMQRACGILFVVSGFIRFFDIIS
jgi:hypothetical protein